MVNDIIKVNDISMAKDIKTVHINLKKVNDILKVNGIRLVSDIRKA